MFFAIFVAFAFLHHAIADLSSTENETLLAIANAAGERQRCVFRFIFATADLAKSRAGCQAKPKCKDWLAAGDFAICRDQPAHMDFAIRCNVALDRVREL